MTKNKPTDKELADAKKLQLIMQEFEKQERVLTAKEDIAKEAIAQAKRKKLFEKKVKPIDPATAAILRAQQDHINEQKSPNPLADMACFLGKCFQCGSKFPPAEKQRQKPYEKPGQIFLCLHCYGLINEAETTGDESQLSLPYAATVACAEEYTQETQIANTKKN